MNLREWFESARGGIACTREPERLPACLANARKLAPAGEFAEAHAAEPELAVHGVGTPTPLAAVLLARRELRLTRRLDDHRCLCQNSSFIALPHYVGHLTACKAPQEITPAEPHATTVP